MTALHVYFEPSVLGFVAKNNRHRHVVSVSISIVYCTQQLNSQTLVMGCYAFCIDAYFPILRLTIM